MYRYDFGFPWASLLFLGLMVLVVVLVVIALTRRTEPATRHDQAVEILRQRYARGEISQAEYEETRRILEGR